MQSKIENLINAAHLNFAKPFKNSTLLSMASKDIDKCAHDHIFGQESERFRKAEKRTLIVMALTLVTMVVEIWAGLAFGSVALLADGLHMGSHATALGINAFAYYYARKYARDSRFSFGTGKVNALGGYTGAILLGAFAFTMAWEGFDKLLNPVEIQFNWAIAVAVVGLIVNGVSVWILGIENHDCGHGHGHANNHTHTHEHKDYNLSSAYAHVLADALTSVLAIAALVCGKYFGLVFLDPLMGLLGAALILHWAYKLILETGSHLLDHQAPQEMREKVKDALSRDDDLKILDLHIWAIAPGVYAAIVALQASNAQSPEHYKSLIPTELGIRHITIEVQS
ncbi:MAG: CDF family Co(II)/Ni(II) efflux transporter DmeF [Alphaproteobacteria bacterium]